MKLGLIFAAGCMMASGHASLAEQAGPDAAVTVDGIYAEATADCTATDQGVFKPGNSPVSEADLTGDGAPEQIINMAGFECSTLASFYGGTGGAPIVVLADGKRFDWRVLGYQIVPVEYMPPVLLMSVHGGECNATGSDPCVEAVVWNGEIFLSVRPGAE
jgi:hypothetical protein